MKQLFRLHSVSLLWKILFSTSIAITAVFAAMGWILQSQFARIAELSLDEEAQTSFHAYESLWNARADQLASESRVMSKTPQIRAAFGTRDKATIKDVALENWDEFSHPGALLMVADPGGTVLVTAGADELYSADFVRSAASKFPEQARGFVSMGGRLYQIVVTPVYVAAAQGEGLLNVLVAGIAVDADLAARLKEATGGEKGGSDFLFFTHGHLVASTLGAAAQREVERISSSQQQIRVAGAKYYQFASSLADLDGNPIGELRILRSFDAADKRISEMRTRLVVLWIGAMIAGLAFTYLLARRLLQPVAGLDLAAAEIAKGNYYVKVPVETGDEIGRLAETFNGMCASIREGREELIRHERIATIGRLSTSIIHDLRNPLAAIYGGAEILVDSDLSPTQVRRLAQNIYRSSRKVQELLQELADVTEGRAHAREICRLREIVAAAYAPLAPAAQAQHVSVRIEVPEHVELPLDRSPMERVFQNLIGNAIEAMPEGGEVRVRAIREEAQVLVSVEDNGPGVPATIVPQLFQPFVTAGKKNGMGLGLALSRKTVLSHGGDLWTEETCSGAKFVMKLPV